jgi:hypothetical protein
MTTEQDFITIKKKHSERQERRRLVRLWWAVVLIWAGLVFAADSMGLMPQIGDASAWSWIFLGAGFVALLGSSFRLISPDIPNPTTWDWVWGGIGGFIALNIFWPLILILVGALALVNGLWRHY